MAQHPHYQNARERQVAKRHFIETATNTLIDLKQHRISRDTAIARLRDAGAYEAEIVELLAA